MKRRLPPDLPWLAGYALLAAVFFAPLLSGQFTLYFDDTNHYYYPIRALGFGALREGRLPLWTPLMQAGYPLLAEGQMGGLYPPQFLFLLLPPPLALSWTVALHAWLAGALQHGYLRALGARPAAAAVGAVAFMLSGAYVGHLVYLPMAFSLVWLPGACWGVELALGGRPRGWLLTAVCLALALLAVHAQMAAYVVLTTLAYAALRGLAERRIAAVGVLGAAVLAGLLAAAQLLPLAELLGQTERGAGLDRGLLTQYGLSPLWLLFLFMPRFFGHPTQGALHWADLTVTWELNAFCGVVTVVLALLAPWLLRERVRWPLLLLWWGTFALAWGRATPLFEALHGLPVMQSFRIPARWLLPGTWAGAALAGLSLEALCAGAPADRIRRAAPFLIGCFVTLLALAWLALGYGQAKGKVHGPELATAARAAALFALSWLLAVGLAAGRPRRFQSGLLALLVVELVAAQRDFNPVTPPSVFSPAGAPQHDPAALALGSTLAAGERIFVPPYAMEYPFLKPSSNVLAGLASIDNFAPLRLARLDTLLNDWKAQREGQRPRDDDAREFWLDRLRVRCTTPDFAPPGTATDPFGLVRRDGLAPLAWQPRRVVAVAAASLARPRLLAARPDPLAIAVVAGPGVSPARRPGAVAYHELSPTRAVVGPVSTGLVVVNGTAYPGWRAWQAGRRLPVGVADSLFRAVAVPADGLLRLVYAPASFRVGLFISLLLLAAMAATLGLGPRRRR